MPFLHTITHRLKIMASRCDAPMIFSAPKKSIGLCLKLTCRALVKTPEKQHVTSNVSSDLLSARKKYTVYRIPLSSGSLYIRQTGRCLNERLQEQKNMCNRVAIEGNHAQH